MKNNGLLDDFDNDFCEEENGLTNRPDKVNVLVEDEEDIRFWDYLLHKVAPNHTFEVSPYQFRTKDTLEKGKGRVLKGVDSFGKCYIGCVDSDYDYLLPECSEYKEKLQNKYVIQTCTYSFENYVCEPSTLRDVCFRVTTKRPECDFEEKMRELSEWLYPVLLWALYFKKQGKEDLFPAAQSNGWAGVMPHGSDHSQNYRQLTKDAAESKLKEFRTAYPDAEPDVLQLGEELKSKFKLSPENAWMYVRGHNLFDYVLDVMIKPICDSLKSEVTDDIRARARSEEEKENIKGHIKKTSRKPHETLIDNFQGIENFPFFSKIKERVQEAIS